MFFTERAEVKCKNVVFQDYSNVVKIQVSAAQ